MTSRAVEPMTEAEAVSTLEALAAQGQEMLQLMEQLAAAVFPASQRDRAHLTWSDAEAAAGASDEHLDPHARTERRLKEAETRFRTLVEQIPAVTFMAVLGEGKNEVYVSPHIEQLLGYSQQEWLENPFLWYWRLHPDDRQLWNDEFARGCQTGGPFRAECRFVARDEHVVWVHGEARIVKDDLGRPMFLQGVAFDITESKRAQEVILNEAVTRARVEEELELARQMQTSILPRDHAVAGLEISATMITASEIGGDYYEVLPVQDGAWLGIGDVAGHGMDAGLVMLMVQSATQAVARSRPSSLPSSIVTLVNEVIYDNITKRLQRDDHVTYTLLRYHSDGRLVFAGAHEDLMIYRRAKRRVERVRTPGIWLGRKRDISRFLTDVHIRLDVGDVLLLYTDGVTEAHDPAGRMFDIDRLTSTLESLGDAPVAEIRDGIVARVKTWMAGTPQADDITVVVVRFVGEPASPVAT